MGPKRCGFDTRTAGMPAGPNVVFVMDPSGPGGRIVLHHDQKYWLAEHQLQNQTVTVLDE